MKGYSKGPGPVARGAAAKSVTFEDDNLGSGLGEEMCAGRAYDAAANYYYVRFVWQFWLLVACGLIFLTLIPALFHHLIFFGDYIPVYH